MGDILNNIPSQKDMMKDFIEERVNNSNAMDMYNQNQQLMDTRIAEDDVINFENMNQNEIYIPDYSDSDDDDTDIDPMALIAAQNGLHKKRKSQNLAKNGAPFPDTEPVKNI